MKVSFTATFGYPFELERCEVELDLEDRAHQRLLASLPPRHMAPLTWMSELGEAVEIYTHDKLIRSRVQLNDVSENEYSYSCNLLLLLGGRKFQTDFALMFDWLPEWPAKGDSAVKHLMRHLTSNPSYFNLFISGLEVQD